MKKTLFTIIILTAFFVNIFAQGDKDTTKQYLIKKVIELMSPHTEMSFTFGTAELKNEKPDFNIEIPNLKDTSEIINRLDGTYNDWKTFKEIADLYKRFNKEQPAYNYYEMAYNTIIRKIQEDTTQSKPYSDMGNLYMGLNNNQQAFQYYQKAYELNENDTSAYNILPMFYVFTGNHDKANSIIKSIIKKDKENFNPYIWLVTMKIMDVMQNQNLDLKVFESKPVDESFSLNIIKELIKKNKKDIRYEVLYSLSKTLALFVKYSLLVDDVKKIDVSKYDLEEVDNLLAYYKKTIKKGKFKSKYVLFKAMGFLHLLKNDLESAKLNIRKSMEYWPKDKLAVDYYILFSMNYFLEENKGKAIEIIKEKIEKDSILHKVNYNDRIILANSYLSMSEDSKKYLYAANGEYKKVLSKQYNKDGYLGIAATLLINNSPLKEINQYINAAYEIDKNYYLTYAMFAIITILNDQKDKAKDALIQAKKIKPDDETINEIYDAFF